MDTLNSWLFGIDENTYTSWDRVQRINMNFRRSYTHYKEYMQRASFAWIKVPSGCKPTSLSVVSHFLLLFLSQWPKSWMFESLFFRNEFAYLPKESNDMINGRKQTSQHCKTRRTRVNGLSLLSISPEFFGHRNAPDLFSSFLYLRIQYLSKRLALYFLLFRISQWGANMIN